MSIHGKIEEAIRDYYETLDSLSSDELDQLVHSIPLWERESEMTFEPPFDCRSRKYSD